MSADDTCRVASNASQKDSLGTLLYWTTFFPFSSSDIIHINIRGIKIQLCPIQCWYSLLSVAKTDLGCLEVACDVTQRVR